jgi:hypothetical protein
VVDADDGRRVIGHKSHRKTPFRRWCGNKNVCRKVVSTSQQTCVFDISLRLVGVENFVHPHFGSDFFRFLIFVTVNRVAFLTTWFIRNALQLFRYG